MTDKRSHFGTGFALGILLAKVITQIIGGIFNFLTGRRKANNPVISRSYSTTEELQTDANYLLARGYRLTSIVGIPGHVDLERAALDGRLGDVFETAFGIRTPDRIVAVFERVSQVDL